MYSLTCERFHKHFGKQKPLGNSETQFSSFWAIFDPSHFELCKHSWNPRQTLKLQCLKCFHSQIFGIVMKISKNFRRSSNKFASRTFAWNLFMLHKKYASSDANCWKSKLTAPKTWVILWENTCSECRSSFWLRCGWRVSQAFMSIIANNEWASKGCVINGNLGHKCSFDNPLQRHEKWEGLASKLCSLFGVYKKLHEITLGLQEKCQEIFWNLIIFVSYRLCNVIGWISYCVLVLRIRASHVT